MRDLRRKLLSLGNHFFERLKTANFSTACGTSTLKSLPSRVFFVSDVHLRPQKHFSRCTLDCGFKTSESPALRGFVGGLRALATAALYLAFFFVLEKGSKSAENAVIPTYPTHWSHGLQHLRHKRPTFAFTPESGYILGFAQRNRTQRLTRRNRSLPSPGHSTVLSCQRNRHRKNSRRKRMHAYGVCPLPPASRPRWAA